MKMLRSMTALLVLCALLLSALPALAADPLNISYLGSFDNPVIIAKGMKGEALKVKVNSTDSGVISLTLTDMVDKNKPVIFTETVTGVSAGKEFNWALPYYDKDMTGNTITKKIRAALQMDGKAYTIDLYYTYKKSNGQEYVEVEKATWYSNNTACSFGPAFRSDEIQRIKPGITDKWYLFTPINLTIQGRQTFDYVASNTYVIGQVYVDVTGDTVTVTYHNYYAAASGNTETVSEFFTFFPDLFGITEVEPENMIDKGYAFGQPISIEKDLNGDTNVLLFVRNRVTYCDYVNSTHKLTRYWPNLPERVTLRNSMLNMMDQQGSY